ncbi:Bro-N domain-containing protein [Vibrio vulnificus]|nr:Bro-N domain-containing protein [Vibrio vulnificus]
MKTDAEGELQPWFVAADVVRAIGSKDAASFTRGLDASEKGKDKVTTLGGTQQLIIISEAGLYFCLLRSNNPKAKPFQAWVTKTVLPSIRKYGGYVKGLERYDAETQRIIMSHLTTQLNTLTDEIEKDVRRSLRRLDERYMRSCEALTKAEAEEYAKDMLKVALKRHTFKAEPAVIAAMQTVNLTSHI